MRFSTVLDFVRFPTFLSVRPVSDRSRVRLVPTFLSVRPVSDLS